MTKSDKAPERIELSTPGLQDQCSSHWAMEPLSVVAEHQTHNEVSVYENTRLVNISHIQSAQ